MKRSHSVVARNMVAPVYSATPKPPPPAAAQTADPPARPAAVEAAHAAMPFPGPYAHVPPPAFTIPIALRPRRYAYPPLMLAAYEGDHAKLDRLLRQRGIDINQLDEGSGGSALVAAAERGYVGIVVALLDAGANVNCALLTSGMTVLMLACANGHVDVVRALLARKELVLEHVLANGRSALHAAAFKNRPEVVACLLAAGANINRADSRNWDTALTLAATRGYVEVVKVLVAWPGIKPDQTDMAGCCALQLGARNNHPDVVKWLLDHRAGSRPAMAGAAAALAVAIDKRHAAVIEVFMEHGADLPDVDFLAPGHDPFTVTLADLHASHRMPVARQLNPLGLLTAPAPNQLHACLQQFIDALDSRRDLLGWLREQGLRMACAVPVAQCLASYRNAWAIPENHGLAQNDRQKQVYCAYALSRLRVLTADDKAVQAYQAAGISSAGVGRLTVVARRQIDALISVADQAVQTLRGRMLQNLVQDCLAKTTASYQIDVDDLAASLLNAGFFSSLAQGLAVSWQFALAALMSEPDVVPAGLTLKQTVQYLREHTMRKAPEFFSRAIMRELDWRAPQSVPRPMLGNPQVGEDLDALFQVQCAQLRQYCQQLLQVE